MRRRDARYLLNSDLWLNSWEVTLSYILCNASFLTDRSVDALQKWEGVEIVSK